MTSSPALRRRLTLPQALAIGVGSMVGAGIFSILGPAAAQAGPWLLPALALAGLTAWANATSTAQLAAVHPTSGGAYTFGRSQLNDWAGFIAGWGFVAGKCASVAAMAFTFALYLVPGATTGGEPGSDWTARWVAIAAVVVLTGINLLGITRTAQATMVIVIPVVAILAVVIVAGFVSGSAGGAGDLPTAAGSPWGALQAAGLLFFAFAGYARVATLGEEVIDPRRSIPRAMLGALVFTLMLYVLLAIALGAAGLAASPAPVRDAVEVMLGSDWVWLAVVGAALASLGSMLNLVAGISRTALAMAREGDLPRPLARVDARTSVPWVAQVVTAVVVIILVLVTDILTVVGFSSFGVLVYYAVANLAASTLRDRVIPGPRWFNLLGLVLCLLLVLTLPPVSVLTMLAVFTVGVLSRMIMRVARR